VALAWVIGCGMAGCSSSSSENDGCVLDTDCEDGEYCASDGNCYVKKSCETDADCEDDEYCSSLGDCRKKAQEDGGTEDDGGNGGGDGAVMYDMPICDTMEIESGSIPPNLLLVVDKSGSMRDPTSQGSSRTKIQDTKDALNALLDEGEGKIRFGWLQFPADSECRPGDVSVECADDSVTEIRQRVNILTPNGGTPTGESLENANDYQGLHDESRNNFVVLLTDGMPTCPNGNGRQENEADNQLALQAVQALHAAAIDTFVIGLGEDINSSNPDLLNQMAEAGGRPRAGQVKYYQANSLEDLREALQDIGGMVIGCNLGLTAVPEWPDYLWVFFDGDAIARDRDHVDGWDYDATRNQINFYGPSCDRLRSGQVNRVEVLMGCAPPP